MGKLQVDLFVTRNLESSQNEPPAALYRLLPRSFNDWQKKIDNDAAMKNLSILFPLSPQLAAPASPASTLADR